MFLTQLEKVIISVTFFPFSRGPQLTFKITLLRPCSDTFGLVMSGSITSICSKLCWVWWSFSTFFLFFLIILNSSMTQNVYLVICLIRHIHHQTSLRSMETSQRLDLGPTGFTQSNQGYNCLLKIILHFELWCRTNHKIISSAKINHRKIELVLGFKYWIWTLKFYKTLRIFLKMFI